MTEQLANFMRADSGVSSIFAFLLGAGLCALTPSGRVAWIVAVLASLIGAILMSARAWADLVPGVAGGVEVRAPVDGVSAIAGTTLAWSAALLALGWGGFVAMRQQAVLRPFLFALLLVQAGAWLGALRTGNWIEFFIAVQAAWLSATGIVALTGDHERASLNGAMRIVVTGVFASVILGVGAALVGRVMGSMEIASVLQEGAPAARSAALGFGLMILALALMIGVAPLHAWTGAAYSRGAGAATMALGVVGAIGGTGAIVRLTQSALESPDLAGAVSMGVATLGVLSIVLGSLQALGATSLMRFGAYVVAMQAGCVLLSVGLGSVAGVSAALVQIVCLCASSLGFFAAAAHLETGPGIARVDGLLRRAPFAAIVLAIALLNVMAAPLTLGFVGRWRLMEAAIERDAVWATVAAVFATLASVFFCGRLIVRMFFWHARETDQHLARASILLAPAMIAACMLVMLGVSPDILVRAAARAALIWGGGS